VRVQLRSRPAQYHRKGKPAIVLDNAATITDLTSAGYAAPASGHLFLKPSPPMYYLP
jgi:hypothetical protein